MAGKQEELTPDPIGRKEPAKGIISKLFCSNNGSRKREDNTLMRSHQTARLYSTRKFEVVEEVKSNGKLENNLYSISDELKDGSSELPSLYWVNGYPLVTIETEHALVPLLLSWGEHERGMMKDHPIYRVNQIMDRCSTHGIMLQQALSLRRYHMRLLNPNINSTHRLGLGTDEKICGTAKRFKSAVETYLRECGIPYEMKETRNLKSIEEVIPGEGILQTPDLLFHGPVNVTTDQPSNGSSSLTEKGQVNWIEIKTCYGASSTPSGIKDPSASILPTARKYVKNHGPGAFVFVYGCGGSLRSLLRDIGVSVLDSNPLNLTEMINHQKTWCANEKGVILP